MQRTGIFANLLSNDIQKLKLLYQLFYSIWKRAQTIANRCYCYLLLISTFSVKIIAS
jgi:hypothetical protein